MSHEMSHLRKKTIFRHSGLISSKKILVLSQLHKNVILSD